MTHWLDGFRAAEPEWKNEMSQEAPALKANSAPRIRKVNLPQSRTPAPVVPLVAASHTRHSAAHRRKVALNRHKANHRTGARI